MSKIVQICMAGTVNNANTQSEALIIVLCEDGSLWATSNHIASNTDGWRRLPLPPDTSLEAD